MVVTPYILVRNIKDLNTFFKEDLKSKSSPRFEALLSKDQNDFV